MLLRFSPLWNRLVFHYLGIGLGFSEPSKRHQYHFYLCSMYSFFPDQSARNNVSKELKPARTGTVWHGAEGTSRVPWLYVWVPFGISENNCMVKVWPVPHALLSSIVATERGHWSELSLAFRSGFTFELTDFIQKRTQEWINIHAALIMKGSWQGVKQK